LNAHFIFRHSSVFQQVIDEHGTMLCKGPFSLEVT
jgi:hypothetical protein